jgi:cytochrome P450
MGWLSREELVHPPPPRARGRVPRVRSALRFLPAPTEFLVAERARLGDTFLLEALGFRILFVFSPTALAALYRLKEEDASFAEATRTLLGFKLPDALLGGDMTMFHHLFGRSRMETYLAHVEAAANEALDALPARGELELFAHGKSVVHRIGFRCWLGPEASTPAMLPRLVALFDRIDPEAAFVNPASGLRTWATRKAPERRALAELEDIVRGIREGRARRGVREGDMLEELAELYAAQPERERDRSIARDVVILHLASLSNLYASFGWTMTNLLLRPAWSDRVREPGVIDAVAMESIRVAQRSITLRKVMRPIELEDGIRRWSLAPGLFLGTMLSVTNGETAALRHFDPGHYERTKLLVAGKGRETVSTFGHGVHACPGQRFALSAIRTAVTAHFDRLEMTPRFAAAEPRPEQIGAVARAKGPCVVAYARR